MINNRSILAVIPARGGSKGLPHKNIRNICGKPLIGWSIEAAQESAYIDRLIVSSEDHTILAAAKTYRCEVPFSRPQSLAKDDTPSIDVILHAIDNIEEVYDYVVMLQPTSPMRTVKDIDGCIEFTTTRQAVSCVSVTPTRKSPYWMFKLDNRHRLRPVLKSPVLASRRQELPITYVLNGAIYIAETKWLQKTKAFITDQTIGYQMEYEHSIDVDSEMDLLWCEFLINLINKRKDS